MFSHTYISLINKIKQERKNHHIVPTLNQMGYMNETLNDYTSAFLNYVSKGPVLDIGVAYGFTTLEALKRGGVVIANDICPQHLKVLKDNTPAVYENNLTLLPGRFPQDLFFEENSLGAVLASRVFHFLTGKEIEQGLEKIYLWLKPQGKVFITAETVYKPLFEKYIPVYEKRKKKKVDFPGEVYNLHSYASGRTENLPDFINFLDRDILEKNLKKAGFIVEKSTMFSKDCLPKDAALKGKETVGIIGIKP